ncbi:AraC family transcriptional regulator [Brevundimonas sp.]
MTLTTKNKAQQAIPRRVMRELTVGAGLVRGLRDFAISKGADPDALDHRSGLEPRGLEDDDTRVPFSRYMALMKAAQAECGLPALALLYGEAIDLSQISVLGLICRASETMLDAFAQMNRYGELVLEADHIQPGDRFRLEKKDGALWLVDNRVIPADFPEMVELAFAQMACGTRPFGKTPFVHALQLAYSRPAHSAEYDRVFQVPITFDARWNAMQVDEAWLTHRVSAAPRYVFGILSQHAQLMVDQLQKQDTARARVETVLMPILHTGASGLDGVAETLGIGRRTLSRRLSAEGVTFETVLDELRCKVAQHYLAEGRISVTETAYLVGFSDPSAFSRAFKRWTGKSPKNARS